jgi:hypothetical protein
MLIYSGSQANGHRSAGPHPIRPRARPLPAGAKSAASSPGQRIAHRRPTSSSSHGEVSGGATRPSSPASTITHSPVGTRMVLGSASRSARPGRISSARCQPQNPSSSEHAQASMPATPATRCNVIDFMGTPAQSDAHRPFRCSRPARCPRAGAPGAAGEVRGSGVTSRRHHGDQLIGERPQVGIDRRLRGLSSPREFLHGVFASRSR